MIGNENLKLLFNRYEDDHRINDLGMVVPFTNSERMNTGCLRLWTYRHVECYEEDKHSDALTYGVIWHSFLEMLLEKMRDTDSVIPEEELLQIVDMHLMSEIENQILQIGGEEYLQELFMFEKTHNFFVRIKTAIVGWMRKWREVMADYRVLEIELALACPIIDEFGNICKFDFYVVKEEDFVRPAQTGEREVAIKLRLPFYKIGKIDVLLECRRTGDLWICDHKTASTPSQYESSIPYDVQLPSYCHLLKWEIEHGNLKQYRGKRVAGIFYDVVKSTIASEPKILKSGELSTAKNVHIPSWVFERTIKENNLSPSKYKDHIQYLKNNADTKFYLHRYVHLTESDLERCFAEDHAVASLIAQKRSELINIDKYRYKQDFNRIAFRFPLCQRYGNCKYSSICVANNHPEVININSSPKIKWTVKKSSLKAFPF